MEKQTTLSLFSEFNSVNETTPELALAQKELLSHVANKDIYRANQYKIYNDVTISRNFEKQNQRRSYFLNCVFDDASFINSGFTGSYFVNCVFKNCSLDFAIFDNCYFNNCKIYSDEIAILKAVSFCNTIFDNSEFRNCYFLSSSLTNINCKNVDFLNCTLDNIIWEGAKLINVGLENVQLTGTNLEFVFFENVRFINTNLPFASIPFAFKCLEHLMHSEYNVRVRSITNEDGINKKAYLDLIPQLIIFYRHTNNYFPLANLLIAIGKTDEAFEEIKKGISFLVKIHEYRTLKYFSILMRINNFSSNQKAEAFELINSELNKQFMSSTNIYNANIYLYEIRDNLLNDREQPYVTFEIYSNIQDNSENKLNLFLNSIETLISFLSPEEKYYIEFRHNSPYQFLITFFSSTQNIVQLISIIYLTYKGYSKFHDDILERQQKRLNIEKTRIEIENKKAKIEIEINDEMLATSDNIREELVNNSIKVGTINHNVYNVDMQSFGLEFQQFNIK